MKDFFQRNIVFIAAVTVTLVVLIGGVFLFSKTPSTNIDTKKISDEILMPLGVYKTSGIKDGKHLPENKSASVTLVEFGDYQCPACSAYSPLVVKLMNDFNGKVNFVFRNFPLPQHANANITSYAAEAAGLQGKFWEMHELLYQKQSEWSESTNAKDIMVGYANVLGLDVVKFKTDIDSVAIKERVTKDIADGNLTGLTGTPTFFINGQKMDNPGSYDEFKKAIDDTLAKSPIATPSESKTYHAHFDLKVFTGGVAADLSLPKYQSPEGKELHQFIHLHDGIGKVVHMHKEGLSLKEFFDSIKITFPPDNQTSKLSVYVGGVINPAGLSYKPNDLDQILVTYGSSDAKIVEAQIKSVSNDACIYSEKCPERGTPPTENCVGGLGTDCEIKK